MAKAANGVSYRLDYRPAEGETVTVGKYSTLGKADKAYLAARKIANPGGVFTVTETKTVETVVFDSEFAKTEPEPTN